MVDIVDAIYSMVGELLDLPRDEDTPQKRVNKIFLQMDLVRCLSFNSIQLSFHVHIQSKLL